MYNNCKNNLLTFNTIIIFGSASIAAQSWYRQQTNCHLPTLCTRHALIATVWICFFVYFLCINLQLERNLCELTNGKGFRAVCAGCARQMHANLSQLNAIKCVYFFDARAPRPPVLPRLFHSYIPPLLLLAFYLVFIGGGNNAVM